MLMGARTVRKVASEGFEDNTESRKDTSFLLELSSMSLNLLTKTHPRDYSDF